jgi:hypothetical protein
LAHLDRSLAHPSGSVRVLFIRVHTIGLGFSSFGPLLPEPPHLCSILTRDLSGFANPSGDGFRKSGLIRLIKSKYRMLHWWFFFIINKKIGTNYVWANLFFPSYSSGWKESKRARVTESVLCTSTFFLIGMRYDWNGKDVCFFSGCFSSYFNIENNNFLDSPLSVLKITKNNYIFVTSWQQTT